MANLRVDLGSDVSKDFYIPSLGKHITLYNDEILEDDGVIGRAMLEWV